MTPIFYSFCATAYAGGMSELLRKTNLDQKIFDFVAPQFKEACALGLTYAVINLALYHINIIVSGTNFIEQTGMYARGYDTNSRYPHVYIAGRILTPIISALSATYLLRQLNYVVPYRFAAVCTIPFIVAGILLSNADEVRRV